MLFFSSYKDLENVILTLHHHHQSGCHIHATYNSDPWIWTKIGSYVLLIIWGKNSHVQPKYLDRDYISEQLIGIQELEIRPLKPGDFANDYFEGQFLGICLNPCPWGSYLLDYRVDRKFIAGFFFSFQRILKNLLRVISLHKGVKERSFLPFLFYFIFLRTIS